MQKFRYSALNEIDNQCTSTVTPVVRGFKVDGDEGGRGPRRALGGGLVRNCAGRHGVGSDRTAG